MAQPPNHLTGDFRSRHSYYIGMISMMPVAEDYDDIARRLREIRLSENTACPACEGGGWLLPRVQNKACPDCGGSGIARPDSTQAVLPISSCRSHAAG
jgi:hypothetical protein